MGIPTITRAMLRVYMVRFDFEDSQRVPFFASVADDMRAHVPPDQRPERPLKWLPVAAKVALFSSGFHAVLVHRMAHSFATSSGPIRRSVSRVGFWFGRHWYGCAIAPTARLYGGLIMPHPQGIVVGAGTVVGPGAWIFQNVTLGGTIGKIGVPRVGSGARICAGAAVVGPINVGNDVVVGANAVVTRDVPDGATVRAPRSEIRAHPEVPDGSEGG
jgi:serine acetyltransferase